MLELNQVLINNLKKLTLQLHCKFWGASLPEYVALGIPFVSDAFSWLHRLFADISLLTVWDSVVLTLASVTYSPVACYIPQCLHFALAQQQEKVQYDRKLPFISWALGPALPCPPHQFPLDASFQSPGGKWAFISLSNNDSQLNIYFLTESWSLDSLNSSLQGMKGSKYPKYLAITSLKVFTSGSPNALSLDMKEENFCRWQCGL